MRGIRSFVHVEVQLEVNFQNKYSTITDLLPVSDLWIGDKRFFRWRLWAWKATSEGYSWLAVTNRMEVVKCGLPAIRILERIALR